jgi:hypothetical protein
LKIETLPFQLRSHLPDKAQIHIYFWAALADLHKTDQSGQLRLKAASFIVSLAA